MKHRPLRIAYGRLFHEANAFSPSVTTLEDFERMHLLEGDALARAVTLRGEELKSFMPHAELTGFQQAVNLSRGEIVTVPLTSALAVPSGPLTRACFDQLTARLLDGIEAALPLDGVYLALHGSMQVQDLAEAPEANLLRRVRALVGSSVKIAVSYDLHANLSGGLVDPVDVLVAYRSNPHWDLAPTGYRAGKRLVRAIRGEIAPVHVFRKLPMVLGGGTTIDFVAPMNRVFRAMKRMEKDPAVVSASLFMVHPYTSAERLGWAAHVCADGDLALAERLADELADLAWEMRKVDLPAMRSPAEAIGEVRGGAWRRLGPVTFIDVDDIVGAGAPGGNTHIVKAVAASAGDLLAYVPVHDPALVEALWSAPLGTKHAVTVRGTPDYHMPEVPLEITVAARTEGDFGRTLRLDTGDADHGLRLVACERAPLPIHPSFWRAVGLEPRRADIIVQKNFFHYRMFYAALSFHHIPVVSAGATSLSRVREQRYDVPMHPQQVLTDWR